MGKGAFLAAKTKGFAINDACHPNHFDISFARARDHGIRKFSKPRAMNEGVLMLRPVFVFAVLFAPAVAIAGFSEVDAPAPAMEATAPTPDPLASAIVKAERQDGAAVTRMPTAPVAAPQWDIQLSDGSLRKLFARWAGRAGWTSLWELDKDIPLVGTDVLPGSFTDAVQAVLRTTESTDTPAHPCFYTNKLLRVLPTSIDCDPERQ